MNKAVCLILHPSAFIFLRAVVAQLEEAAASNAAL
jgi:hypothetical protein